MAAPEYNMVRDTWTDGARLHRLHRTAVRLDRMVEGSRALFVKSLNVTFGRGNILQSHYLTHISNIDLSDAEQARAFSYFSATIEIYQNVSSLLARIFRTVSATIGLYRNLASLHIQLFTITASFRQTLGSLSRLDDLCLRNCDIVARTGFLALKTLTISGHERDNVVPLQIATPSSLQSLNLDFGGTISPLISGFGPGKLLRLTHLSHQCLCDPDIFFAFLKQCPGLLSLAIHSTGPHITLPPAIHSNTIPLLRHLTGSPKVVRLFAPNRPIVGLTVLANKRPPVDLVSLLTDISRNSVPLDSLVLPSYPLQKLQGLVAILALFPELRELSLEVFGYELVHGRRRRTTNARATIDTQSLVIDHWLVPRDEAAFDELPPDDLSDTEDQEYSSILTARESIPRQLGIYKFLTWILNGVLVLPRNLEVLILRMSHRTGSQELSLAQQHHAIVELKIRYPCLHEVQFGNLADRWRFTSEYWRSAGNKFCIKVT
ncbi:hypothetical protein B0H19DRAFT_1258695 [Mycena capillaripes]|nr:hypothetical protein B0H19DRAFT_1258695 [Mycena capillaripes]